MLWIGTAEMFRLFIAFDKEGIDAKWVFALRVLRNLPCHRLWQRCLSLQPCVIIGLRFQLLHVVTIALVLLVALEALWHPLEALCRDVIFEQTFVLFMQLLLVLLSFLCCQSANYPEQEIPTSHQCHHSLDTDIPPMPTPTTRVAVWPPCTASKGSLVGWRCLCRSLA